MSDILARLLGFIDNKNTRLAVAAVVITTLLVSCGIAITSVSYDHGWKFIIRPEFQAAFVIAYLVLFVTSWFILYLLNSKDATDVYSEAREKLVGQWIVTYEANVGPVSQQVVVASRTIGCFISVNELKKLEMVFRIHDNPIFRDDEKQVVRDVAIRANESGGYTIFYYYAAPRGIQPQVAIHILPEEGQNQRPDEVEVEIFARVNFEKSPAGGVVNKMQGKWFDLNGNVSRLLALLDSQKVAEIRSEEFKPMRLSQVPIHQKNFDADMGAIEFSRMTKGD